MKVSVWNAWAFGGAIVLITSGMPTALIICDAWFGLSHDNEFLTITILLLLSGWMPAVAAFVVGYLAPRRKILLGTSMALLAAIFSSVINSSYQALDYPVDFSGVNAGIILFFISLITNMMLCGVGAALGAFGDSLVHPAKANNSGEFGSTKN